MATMTAPAAPPAAPPSAYLAALAEALVRLPPEQQFVAARADWAAYQYLLAVRDRNRRTVVITYDRGRLEVMSHSGPHERWKAVLARLIEAATEELGVPIVGCGNATVSRHDLDRGVEPDVWYYIGANAGRMAAVREFDFATDPPPDLAVEVEASRSFVDRLAVAAALRIAEVWRFDGTALEVLRLTPAGGYEAVPASGFLPRVAPAEIARYARMVGTVDDTSLVRQFRDWVRQALVPPPPA